MASAHGPEEDTVDSADSAAAVPRARARRATLASKVAIGAVVVAVAGATILLGTDDPPTGRDRAPSQPGKPKPGPGGPGGVPAKSEAQPVAGYRLLEPTRLQVGWVTGVAACYGEVGAPVVRETSESVTVTLTRTLPADPAQACIEIAELGSTVVDLDAPLGARPVIDGSPGGAKVPAGLTGWDVPGEPGATP